MLVADVGHLQAIRRVAVHQPGGVAGADVDGLVAADPVIVAVIHRTRADVPGIEIDGKAWYLIDAVLGEQAGSDARKADDAGVFGAGIAG